MFLEKAQHVFRKGVACFWKERSLFFGKAQHLLSESLARPSRVGPVFPRAVAAPFFDSLRAVFGRGASFRGNAAAFRHLPFPPPCPVNPLYLII